MKNKIVLLTNTFLYEKGCNDVDILEEIIALVIQDCNKEKALLIKNVVASYNDEKSNFCTIESAHYRKELIPMFTAIFSILSLPE